MRFTFDFLVRNRVDRVGEWNTILGLELVYFYLVLAVRTTVVICEGHNRS